MNVEVIVRENNVDQAMRYLKKKMQKEGIFRALKENRYHEKPSERRVRKASESLRRIRKLLRKQQEKGGRSF